MKVAIMTGGGDSPGMNAFIRAVVRSCLNLRPATSVWGVIDGWHGLINGNFRKLSKKDTAGISHQGGTILGTLRVPELKDNRDMQEACAFNLHDNYFDYLFIIGGNGSLAAANVLNNIIKEKGLRTKILVAPGSIDNDVCNNYGYSIGFYSAIDKSLEMLEWIRDTASAHRRVYIIESMGRDSGFLAFYAGVATGAEHIILPNDNVNFEQLVNLISDRDRDSRIIVAEGYPKTADEIRKILEEIFSRRNIKHEIRHVDMGYFQRGGKAAVKDIITASWLGFVMVKEAFEGVESAFYTCFRPGEDPVRLPLEVAVDSAKTSSLDVPEKLKEFAMALT